MTDSYFVDTNVFVYARDASEPDKQPRAAEWIDRLWRERSGRISVQVLQELYQILTRKLDPGLDPETARAEITDLLAWSPSPIDEQTFELAWNLEDRFSLSWWDALIVASARQTRCRYLLTEDLQDGQVIGELEILNPFT